MTERKLKLGAEDKRIVWGEVYVPDVPDSDGEFMTAHTIEKAAYDFMRNLRLKKSDTDHNNMINDCCVIESFIARKGDPDFLEGAWVVGMHVTEPVWKRIKSGELNGFSIEAFVSKDDTILEIEVPPVLSGMTQKHDDHEHQFHVSFDGEGNFLGGVTDATEGHYHVIKRGTITEEAGGHHHRFSTVDVMAKVMSGQLEMRKADVSGEDLTTAGKKNPDMKGGKKPRKGALAKHLMC